MDPKSAHSAVWALARRQHGLVTRRQLLALGYSSHAIDWRIRNGRLHGVRAGVYAVGAPRLSERGRLMAAVLFCGDGAALSHESAARLWGFDPPVPLRSRSRFRHRVARARPTSWSIDGPASRRRTWIGSP